MHGLWSSWTVKMAILLVSVGGADGRWEMWWGESDCFLAFVLDYSY